MPLVRLRRAAFELRAICQAARSAGRGPGRSVDATRLPPWARSPPPEKKQQVNLQLPRVEVDDVLLAGLLLFSIFDGLLLHNFLLFRF